jgi:WhiB family redox-sensing transcriptional regulator
LSYVPRSIKPRALVKQTFTLPTFDLDLALCGQTDPEIFFPEQGGSPEAAKKICVQCEVRLNCLEWALSNEEEHGVWGGLTAQERKRIKRGGSKSFEVKLRDKPIDKDGRKK